MKKVTFTLDDETVERLKKLAARRRWPQSRIVREAVTEYGKREHTLTPEEIARKLEILDEIARLPRRPQSAVDSEQRAIRRARRAYGRRHRID